MEKVRNNIVNKSEDFAVMIIEYCRCLRKANEYEISHQLIKSGTSIGANIAEAQDAESKADFLHKMKIANKEANETRYWLTLSIRCRHVPNPPENLVSLVIEIRKILSTITRKLDGK